MRRTLLIAISAAAALVIVAVVVGILLNNARQPQHTLTGQAHPTACGTLAYAANHLMTQASAAQSSATCYAIAVKACHAATPSATVMGVDTGEAYNFTVSSECQPAITRTLSGIGPQTTSTTATCQSVTATASELDFTGCGTLGNLALPTTRGGSLSNG